MEKVYIQSHYKIFTKNLIAEYIYDHKLDLRLVDKDLDLIDYRQTEFSDDHPKNIDFKLLKDIYCWKFNYKLEDSELTDQDLPKLLKIALCEDRNSAKLAFDILFGQAHPNISEFGKQILYELSLMANNGFPEIYSDIFGYSTKCKDNRLYIDFVKYAGRYDQYRVQLSEPAPLEECVKLLIDYCEDYIEDD